MKKALLMLLKVGLSAAIIGYLVWDATKGKDGGNTFANLRDEPKDWSLLAAAWVLLMVANVLTFIRWGHLARAIGIPCRTTDAIRIGFWGFLFNLAPLGVVAGDLVKAVMLAREHRQHRAEAAASVLVDRVVGVYLLFLFATVAILLTGFWKTPVAEIRWICKATFLVTGIGAAGIAAMLTSDVAKHLVIRMTAGIPRAGHLIRSLLDAVWMYRRQPAALGIASLMTMASQALSAAGCYLIARGLPGEVLSLKSHFVMIPLCIATCILPLPLGPFEFVLEFFYTHVSAGVTIMKGQGLVVALIYRLMTLLMAGLGVLCYLGNRRELADVIHEVDEERPEEPEPAG